MTGKKGSFHISSHPTTSPKPLSSCTTAHSFLTRSTKNGADATDLPYRKVANRTLRPVETPNDTMGAKEVTASTRNSLVEELVAEGNIKRCGVRMRWAEKQLAEVL